MAWHDRDYGRSPRPDPDDDDVTPEPDYAARSDDEDDEPERFGHEDDEQDSSDDPEGPDAADRDDRDEPALISCPNCGKKVVEDAERCHHCGHYIQDEEVARKSNWWLWVGGVLVAALVIRWLIPW